MIGREPVIEVDPGPLEKVGEPIATNANALSRASLLAMRRLAGRLMAERVGFEPTIPLRVYRFSSWISAVIMGFSSMLQLLDRI